MNKGNTIRLNKLNSLIEHELLCEIDTSSIKTNSLWENLESTKAVVFLLSTSDFDTYRDYTV